MSDDIMLLVFLCLAVGCHILIVWKVTMLSHEPFAESEWVRQGRRMALVLVGVGVLLMARFHIEQGRAPWPAEFLIIGGIDLYIGLIIFASYARLRRIGIRLSYRERQPSLARSAATASVRARAD